MKVDCAAREGVIRALHHQSAYIIFKARIEQIVMTIGVLQCGVVVLGVKRAGLGYCGGGHHGGLMQGQKKWGGEVLPAAASTAPVVFNFTILPPRLNIATGENVKRTSSQFFIF